MIAFRVSDNEINAIDPVSVSDNTPGHSGNAPETLTTGIGHPYDNLPCHLTDNPRPTAAAIVALCLLAGVAGAFGLALWGLVGKPSSPLSSPLRPVTGHPVLPWPCPTWKPASKP